MPQATLHYVYGWQFAKGTLQSNLHPEFCAHGNIFPWPGFRELSLNKRCAHIFYFPLVRPLRVLTRCGERLFICVRLRVVFHVCRRAKGFSLSVLPRSLLSICSTNKSKLTVSCVKGEVEFLAVCICWFKLNKSLHWIESSLFWQIYWNCNGNFTEWFEQKLIGLIKTRAWCSMKKITDKYFLFLFVWLFDRQWPYLCNYLVIFVFKKHNFRYNINTFPESL